MKNKRILHESTPAVCNAEYGPTPFNKLKRGISLMFLINLQNKDTFIHHSLFQFLEKHHVFPRILGKDISLCHTFQVLHERVLTVHIGVNGYLALVMKMKASQFTQSISFSKRSHRNVHQPTAVIPFCW